MIKPNELLSILVLFIVNIAKIHMGCFSHVFISEIRANQKIKTMEQKTNSTTINQLLTKEDLVEFRKNVVADIRELIIKSVEKPTWIKSGEARQLLKISRSTLQLMRINGTISFTKLGNIFYYNYEDINKMMNKSK
jgi:hypothetical protein